MSSPEKPGRLRPAGAPTPPSQRVTAIDVVRGFTLWGILYANILWISGFLDLSRKLQAPMLAGFLDRTALFLIRLLVFGKFYYLFAFLFGVGFSLQLERAAAAGRPFAGYFVRRMAVLFVLGWLHALFVWWGDILRFYALLGVVLLLSRGLSDRRLHIAIGVCLLAPLLLQVGQAFLWPATKLPRLATLTGRAELDFFRTARYGEWFAYNARQVLDSGLQQFWDGRVFKMLGMFLTGRLASQYGLFRDSGRHGLLLKRLLLWGAVLGIAGNFGKTALHYLQVPLSAAEENVLAEFFYLFGVPGLSACYLAMLLLLLRVPAWADRLKPLSALGRVSLSTYVSQILICALLFRPFGLGLYARLGVAKLAILATGILLLQSALAALWLRRFRFGPLEWLWRSATYGRFEPMGRDASVSPPG